jgi:DNA-binding FadR family transcriptional regulator
MTDEDLAGLRALLAELQSQLQDAQAYQETDTRYHDFIMRCSGNRLGRSIIRWPRTPSVQLTKSRS